MTTLATQSDLSPNGSTSRAEACTASLEADKILAALRPHIIAQLKSHKAPSFHIDHVLGAGTADARIVSVASWHQFTAAGG